MDYSKIEGAKFVRFKKNERVVIADEKTEFFYIVVDGRCHRILVEENGKELIKGTYKKGSILCAVTSYIDMIPQTDIIADTTLLCWQIPRNSFLKILDTSPELNKKMLEQIINEYLELSSLFRNKKNYETPKSLCNFLLTHASENSDGNLIIDKSFTNTAIANHLGVHRVTATRIINTLQKNNVILRTKVGLQIIDINQLKCFASGMHKLKYK